MLSNENPNPNTSTIDSYVGELAQMQAKRLASQLIVYEHNDDVREAPNPAHGVHVRVMRPIIRVNVDQECKDHNSRTSNLGASEEWAASWKR